MEIEGFFSGPIIKNLSANAVNTGDEGSKPGSGRSPGGENGNTLQYSCLENPMDRGALGVRVYRVTKESNMTKQLSTHALIIKIYNINNSFLVPENTHPYSHMQQSCFPNSGVSIQVMGQLLSPILLLQTGGPGKILL